jgi:hypothetical protein
VTDDEHDGEPEFSNSLETPTKKTQQDLRNTDKTTDASQSEPRPSVHMSVSEAISLDTYTKLLQHNEPLVGRKSRLPTCKSCKPLTHTRVGVNNCTARRVSFELRHLKGKSRTKRLKS